MKSAILKSALQHIRDNTDSGAWLSITHFSLAWASDEERTSNPVSSDMSEVIVQGANIKGDYIYNIWQTPFPYDEYAGSFFALDESYGKYFQYEYDVCEGKNVLKCNQFQTADSWPSELSAHFPFGTVLNGYVNPSATNPNPTQVGSQLSEANLPYYLDYSFVENRHRLVTPFTKLFPIKSYTSITDKENSEQILVNYNLSLPPLGTSASGDASNYYANSIGNFKFNRIGIYMTPCADPVASTSTNPKDVYTPQATAEPILFAVIDIGVDSCSGNDVKFDIFKTRDDSGFAGWDFDAQLPISIVGASNLAQSQTTFYADSVRDDSTNYYLAQMMNNAAMAESIMQLQMMVLQLANRVEAISGVNPFTEMKTSGYNVNGTLVADSEVILTKTSLNNKMLLDAMSFRGVQSSTVQYINSRNALFSLKSGANDGDFVKITIYNLDGSYYTRGTHDVQWWNGKVLFANYAEDGTKTKLFEINAKLIKGMKYAKVTLLFSYSADLGRWILESQSVINESAMVS